MQSSRDTKPFHPETLRFYKAFTARSSAGWEMRLRENVEGLTGVKEKKKKQEKKLTEHKQRKEDKGTK